MYTCFRGNTVNNTNRSFQEFANNPLAVTHPVQPDEVGSELNAIMYLPS